MGTKPFWEYFSIGLRFALDAHGAFLVIRYPWRFLESGSMEWEDRKSELHEEA